MSNQKEFNIYRSDDAVSITNSTSTITTAGSYKLINNIDSLTITGVALDPGAMVYIDGDGYTIGSCTVSNTGVNFYNCVFGTPSSLSGVAADKYSLLATNDPARDYGYWGSALLYSDTPLSLTNCEFIGNDLPVDNTQANSGMVGVLIGSGASAGNLWRSVSSVYRAKNSKITNCRFTNLRVGLVLREFIEYYTITSCIFAICNVGAFIIGGNNQLSGLSVVYCGAGVLFLVPTAGTWVPDNDTGYGSAIVSATTVNDSNGMKCNLGDSVLNHCYSSVYVTGIYNVGTTLLSSFAINISGCRVAASTYSVDVNLSENVQVISCNLVNTVRATGSTAKVFLIACTHAGGELVSSGKIFIDNTCWSRFKTQDNVKNFALGTDANLNYTPLFLSNSTNLTNAGIGTAYFNTGDDSLRIYNGTSWKVYSPDP